ncbi:hypothetical protein KIN20_022861 [Parelaphostrongylus tenuis]|uniref:Uncharacterized protein n=1 Tax=Parelaphostrongylus tenuis TaxID=148309 RepID=A0AAD5MW30_PARTN|nr:hypothetical protein KIN20_022861 [Parelaphostrongylus tenuis]
MCEHIYNEKIQPRGCLKSIDLVDTHCESFSSVTTHDSVSALEHNFQTAFDNINRGKGPQVLGRTTTYKWFGKFHNGIQNWPSNQDPEDRVKLIER